MVNTKWLLSAGILLCFIFPIQKLAAQNYCAYPDAFVTPSHPKNIDTFTINVHTVTNYYGDAFIVRLRFSVPKDDGAPFSKRPLMLGIHGGGFLSDYYLTGSATQAWHNTSAMLQNDFTTMGWVTASLDYRTGFGLAGEKAMLNALNNPNSAYCDSLTPGIMKEFTRAAYTAAFDCRMAIDYIFKDTFLTKFIDTTQVYLFGGSAGAITAFHTVFSETDEFFENTAGMPAMAQKHKLAGVIGYAGAMADSYTGNMLHHMDAGEGVPIFMVHGMADRSVPYNTGTIAQCANTTAWHGSATIADKLCSLNIPFELYLIDGAGHDVRTRASHIAFAASLAFIKNRGLCPKNIPSYKYHFDLMGKQTQRELCPE